MSGNFNNVINNVLNSNKDLNDSEIARILVKDSASSSNSSGISRSRYTSDNYVNEPPKLNQRFLLNTLKSVDDHNSSVKHNTDQPSTSSNVIDVNVDGDKYDSFKDFRTNDSKSFAKFTKRSKRKRDDKSIEKKSSKSSKSKSKSPFIESKMDKYFENDYDPSTDISLPSNANDHDFDAWNEMLENVRERNKLKREREQEFWEVERKKERELENMRLGREKAKIAKLLGPDAEEEYQRHKKQAKRERKEQIKDKFKESTINSITGHDNELFNIQYGKKGSTREWDVGKS